MTSPVFAQAQEVTSEDTQLVLNNTSYEPNYLSMLFGLAFVILLIYVSGFLYQNLLGVNAKFSKVNQKGEKNKINLVSALPLGQGKNLYLVEVNSKAILLGATQTNISQICEVELEKESVELKEKSENE